MKTRLKQLITVYFSSSGVPAVTALVIGLALAAIGTKYGMPVLRLAVTPLLYLFLASLAGLFIASIVSFVKKRWLAGIMDLFLIPFIMIVVGIAAMLASGGGDDFADNLDIPKNISISMPGKYHDDKFSEGEPVASPKDSFASEIIRSLQKDAGNDPTVKADIPSLADLYKHHPRVLHRYLACSPYWRLFEHRGSVYASRRIIIGPHWHYREYSNCFDFGKNRKAGITIGLSGRPWIKISSDSTILKPGESKKLKLFSGKNSQCVIKEGDLAVEVYESRMMRERCMTKAALLIWKMSSTSWRYLLNGQLLKTRLQALNHLRLNQQSSCGIHSSLAFTRQTFGLILGSRGWFI